MSCPPRPEKRPSEDSAAPEVKERQMELFYDILIPETILHVRQKNHHILACQKNMIHYAVIPVKFTGQYIMRMSQTVQQDTYVDLFARCETVSLLLEGSLRWTFVKGDLKKSRFTPGYKHLTIQHPVSKDQDKNIK